MGVAGGPNILGDENLVFAYDVADQNSYLGEPTTNFIPSPYDYSLYAYASGPVNITTTNESGNTITAKRYTITQAVNVARAAIFPTGLTTGVAYTFSVKWRYNGTTTTTPGFGMDASKGNPEVGGSNTFTSQSSSVISIGRGWYLSTYTFIFNTSPTSGCILTFGISTGATAGYVNETFDLYEAQFEVKDHRTQPIIGSRSISGSLLDLTPNRSLTILNTSYDSNAQIIFNGINNYISVANSDLVNPGTGSFTIICWVNSDPSVTGDGWDLWVAKRVDGSNGYYVGVNNPLGARFMIGNNVGGRTDTGFISYTYNTWAMFTSILDRTNNTQTIIRNAYEETSTVTPAGGTYSNASNLYIGGDVGLGAFYVNGRQPIVSIYNRALSQSEVIQNYNAFKSRFNL